MDKTSLKVTANVLSTVLTFGALAAEPTISDVVVRQRWPWSRRVDIDYVLTCDSSQSVDISLTAKDGLDTLALPIASLTGDLYNVSHGPHRIVWDPTVTAYTNNQMLTQFSVTLTPVETPLYMIVDLTKAAGAADQCEYVRESDLTNGLWGAWERNPVTNLGTVVESVVWTGVTTNDIFKTDKLVLRRIRAGTFGMGSSASLSTTLTKDFYAGVFEVTQRQWELIMGTKPSWFNNAAYYASRPVEQVSYDNVRGATNSNPAVNWPGTDRTVVTASSFLGKLRTMTDLTDFDLPTDAQWEYACRAGTTTVFNDGNASANVTGSNGTGTNVWLNALGRYKFDGGWLNGSLVQDCSPTNGTAVVGSYLPNAWGLYDTHGNVREWCLDWYGTLVGGSDPSGASSGSQRVSRGGSLGRDAAYCPSWVRNAPDACPPTYINGNQGFRLVRTLQ